MRNENHLLWKQSEHVDGSYKHVLKCLWRILTRCQRHRELISLQRFSDSEPVCLSLEAGWTALWPLTERSVILCCMADWNPAICCPSLASSCFLRAPSNISVSVVLCFLESFYTRLDKEMHQSMVISRVVWWWCHYFPLSCHIFWYLLYILMYIRIYSASHKWFQPAELKCVQIIDCLLHFNRTSLFCPCLVLCSHMLEIGLRQPLIIPLLRYWPMWCLHISKKEKKEKNWTKLWWADLCVMWMLKEDHYFKKATI